MGRLKDDCETHESWGVAGFSRVTGTTRLFGSDVQHHETLCLRIHAAQRQRDLSNDFVYEGPAIIEVEFSPNQYAALLTQQNSGKGVPCTIKFREKMGVIKPKIDASRHALFEKEIVGHSEHTLAKMDELREAIESLSISQKKKAELAMCVSLAKQEIQSNMPFVLREYREAMSKMVEDAKGAVDSFATGLIMRTGLQALRGKLPELPGRRTCHGVIVDSDTGTEMACSLRKGHDETDCDYSIRVEEES